MRAGEWCAEHHNGYDDCSFLHRPPLPHSGLRLVEVESDDLHGLDCLCPGACQEWVLTNAGRGFNEDGTPR